MLFLHLSPALRNCKRNWGSPATCYIVLQVVYNRRIDRPIIDLVNIAKQNIAVLRTVMYYLKQNPPFRRSEDRKILALIKPYFVYPIFICFRRRASSNISVVSCGSPYFVVSIDFRLL